MTCETLSVLRALIAYLDNRLPPYNCTPHGPGHKAEWIDRADRLIKEILMTETKYYLLADCPRCEDYEKLGCWLKDAYYNNPFRQGITGIAAVKTGEKRSPKAGEWYLSGSEPQAWRAYNDFTTPYHILRLVTVKTTIVATTTEIS